MRGAGSGPFLFGGSVLRAAVVTVNVTVAETTNASHHIRVDPSLGRAEPSLWWTHVRIVQVRTTLR